MRVLCKLWSRYYSCNFYFETNVKVGKWQKTCLENTRNDNQLMNKREQQIELAILGHSCYCQIMNQTEANVQQIVFFTLKMKEAQA